MKLSDILNKILLWYQCWMSKYIDFTLAIPGCIRIEHKQIYCMISVSFLLVICKKKWNKNLFLIPDRSIGFQYHCQNGIPGHDMVWNATKISIG